jgi:hypothetical protein
MIQKAFGNVTLVCTEVKECFRLFKDRGTSVKSVERSGRPFMSRNQLISDKFYSTMLDNQGITIRKLCDELGLSFGLVQSILTRFGHEMHLSKICPRNADSRAETD